MTGCPDADLWRTALSARLDGEESDVSSTDLRAHMADCADCADWYQRSLTLADQIRHTRPAPDLTLQLIGVTEAHICGCHRGEACECTNCQCVDCTCGRRAG